MFFRFFCRGAAIFVLLGFCAGLQPATGAEFPAKPIQLIVPFTAGGVVDIMGRLVSEKSAEFLGQPMVVLNKPGAGATLGFNLVAKARPDGYTLGIGGNPPLTIRKAIDPNLG